MYTYIYIWSRLETPAPSPPMGMGGPLKQPQGWVPPAPPLWGGLVGVGLGPLMQCSIVFIWEFTFVKLIRFETPTDLK